MDEVTKPPITNSLAATKPNLSVTSDTVIKAQSLPAPKRWSDEGIPETQVHVLQDAGVKELLVHQDTMTKTLRDKVNDGKPIEVNKILGPFDDSNGIRTRVVILRDIESQRILSLGLIKIDLKNLSDTLVKDLGNTYTPFGELLAKHNLLVKGNVQKFYRMSTPKQKREKLFFLTEPVQQEAFRFEEHTDIFGRYNVLTRTDNGNRVARVYEFLAADSKV